jgi:Peptidase A4 family
MTLEGARDFFLEKGDRVKRLLVSTLTAALLGGSAFLVAASAASPAANLGARAQSPAVVAKARAAFNKYMASHAEAVSARSWVSPKQTKLPGATKPAKGTASSFPSLNWSGFADTSSTSTADDFSYVSGNWTIPQVSCPSGAYRTQGAYIANWVGIDGFSDSTVEQLGTAAECYEGVLYYFDWYEMFPGGTVEEGTTACINYNVDCPRPGDQISASVTVTPGSKGEKDYTLSLTDQTRRQESFSVSAKCATSGSSACADSSAEWIVERPAYEPASGLIEFVPLVYYGRTGFESGSLVADGHRSSVGGFNGAVYDIPMVDDSVSYYLDCPGQRAPVGSVLPFTAANCPAVQPSSSGGFDVAWDSSF